MNKLELSVKDSSIAFVSSFIICQLVVIIFSMLLLVFSAMFNVGDITIFLQSAIGTLTMNFVMYATMLGVFLFLNKNKQNKIFTKPTINKTLIYTLIATASYFMLYPIVTCANGLFAHLGIELSSFTYELNTGNYFISLISLVIIPAVCEELLFRGLIFKGLKQGGKSFAIVISSLMFAIFHMSITQTVYPILFGLLLSFVMLKENNLYYCILMHLINNFLALTTSYLNISLIFNHWTYILLAIVLLAIYLCILIIFIKKQKIDKNSQKINKNNKIFLIISILAMLIFWVICNINR